ncbi:SGNH/GDSL hydrolase family protein [Photobacterium sp. ZSDE20]|uniref:SGNH/GDSL hydrolase family protein n=1 Tax=Photobacterium pectinilyticum TaxID=2906793 RepID=A0ABT1N901_9GAMM|nr:SGNH/GDSL hydrolase family protein [Photobacterium sp. ZSDE20]MCQ1061234.1 SGNH/GDSL hydrolase family protein [Photobacterium sp. ZSDE20]MDD1829650.1 SGNH/GDSL hydrolase family protein [Photobacterium sp. ZSDE20]
MLHQFILVVMAPIFLVQGKHVRKSIPCLKEAAGPRRGQSEKIAGREGKSPPTKKPLRILLLGDSAAAGVGAEHQSQALSGQLISALHHQFHVEWQLIAKTGFTTKQVHQSALLHPKQMYDVVVVSAGVNDVTKPTSAAKWIKQQQMLTNTLRSHFSCQHIILNKIPPMEVFPSLPHPLRWYLGSKAKAFNKKLAKWVETQPDCELVNIGGPLDVMHMATDGFHPGPKIYRQWGQAVAQIIEDRWTGSGFQQQDIR